MALVQIGVMEGQLVILRSLVGGSLREEIEALRQGEIERTRATPSIPDDDRAEGFFQDTLGLLGSDLVGLYRLFLPCAEEEPEGAPGEGSGEGVEETD